MAKLSSRAADRKKKLSERKLSHHHIMVVETIGTNIVSTQLDIHLVFYLLIIRAVYNSVHVVNTGLTTDIDNILYYSYSFCISMRDMQVFGTQNLIRTAHYAVLLGHICLQESNICMIVFK